MKIKTKRITKIKQEDLIGIIKEEIENFRLSEAEPDKLSHVIDLLNGVHQRIDSSLDYDYELEKPVDWEAVVKALYEAIYKLKELSAGRSSE